MWGEAKHTAEWRNPRGELESEEAGEERERERESTCVRVGQSRKEALATGGLSSVNKAILKRARPLYF